MPADVSTTVTELPESRVRVEAEVPAAEVEKRVAQAAKALGRNLRVPGFRTGKVPPPVIIQRVGRDAVLDEAVRESIAGWYSAAIDRAKVVPVGEPDLNLAELPGEGEPLRFSIEIGVRPEAKLGDYEGLEVGRREPNVGDEAIQAEIEALRERSAKLETTDRAAASGDFVVMDFLGTLDGEPFPGGEGRDQMVELGSGRLVPGLRGAARGRERRRRAHGQDRLPRRLRRRRAGRARGRVRRHASRRSRPRTCPSSTTTSPPRPGFDTLDELREDIRERLSEAQTAQIDAEFREAARRLRRRRRHDRRPGRADRRPRARAVGADGPHARRTRGSRRRPTSRSPASPRTRSSPTTASRPGATCAARPCSPPSSRPRASRRATRSCSSRSSAPPPPTARRPRSCSSACAPAAASTRCATSSRSARRSTTSPTPPSRSRSSRRRRARSSGRRARDEPGKGRSERALDARKLAF